MNIVLSGINIFFSNFCGIKISEVIDKNTILVISNKKKNFCQSSSKIKLAFKYNIPIIYI